MRRKFKQRLLKRQRDKEKAQRQEDEANGSPSRPPFAGANDNGKPAPEPVQDRPEPAPVSVPEGKHRPAAEAAPKVKPSTAPVPEQKPGPAGEQDTGLVILDDAVQRINALPRGEDEKKELAERLSMIKKLKEREESHPHDDKDILPIMLWTRRPAGVKGHMQDVKAKEDELYKELCVAADRLSRHERDLEEGPYADKDAKLQGLAEPFSQMEDPHEMCLAVAGYVTDLDGVNFQTVRDWEIDGPYETVEGGQRRKLSFMDLLMAGTKDPDEYHADIAAWLRVPDVIPTAGEIFTQEERHFHDKEKNRMKRMLTHDIEPLLLGVALLRRASRLTVPKEEGEDDKGKGVEYVYPALKDAQIYPALSADSEGHPLIAIIRPSEKDALVTIPYGTRHPMVYGMDVISDAAMNGLMHVVLAETRTRYLAMEMERRAKEGELLPDKTIEERMKTIAEQIFECHRTWPGEMSLHNKLSIRCNQFVCSAIGYIRKSITQARMVAQHANSATIYQRLVQEDPPLRFNPMMLEKTFLDVTLIHAQIYGEKNAYIASERLDELDREARKKGSA